MCPYWNERLKLCRIFSTSSPSDNCIETWCREGGADWSDCPNYEQAKRYNGGTVPSPEYYKEKNGGW